MGPADDTVRKPSFFLQPLHRCANSRARDLLGLTEDFADLEDRNLSLVPDDFHDFALAFGERWQFWLGHVRFLMVDSRVTSTRAVIMATYVAIARAHGDLLHGRYDRQQGDKTRDRSRR